MPYDATQYNRQPKLSIFQLSENMETSLFQVKQIKPRSQRIQTNNNIEEMKEVGNYPATAIKHYQPEDHHTINSILHRYIYIYLRKATDEIGPHEHILIYE